MKGQKSHETVPLINHLERCSTAAKSPFSMLKYSLHTVLLNKQNIELPLSWSKHETGSDSVEETEGEVEDGDVGHPAAHQKAQHCAHNVD